MISQTRDRLTTLVLILAVAGGVAGCGKKKKPPPPPPPPPAKVVELPKPVDIAAVLQEAKADSRVNFPESKAPADRTLAEGVIKLANALVKGDAPGLKSQVDGPTKAIVDQLVSSGGWDDTKTIEQVRVVSLTGTSDSSATISTVGFAVQSPGSAYLLAWNGKKDGEHWVFSASPCQGDTRARASDFDGVALSTANVSSQDDMDTLRNLGPGAAPGKNAAPGATPPPADPNTIKKNTPAGPINIPKGRPPSGPG